MGKTAKIQSGVTIALDKMRTLKWTTEAKAEFEDAISIWITGRPGNPNYTTRNILYNQGASARVLLNAMYWALHDDDPDLKISDVSKLIDDYKAKGNTAGKLIDALAEALEWADNPSSAPSFQKKLKSLQRLAELQAAEERKKEEAALKEIEEKIKSKETGDGTPSASVESS